MEVVLLLLGLWALTAKGNSSGSEKPVLDLKPVAGAGGTGNRVPSALANHWYRYDAWFRAYAEDYGVDWTWLKAIAMTESSLGTNSRVVAGIQSSDGLSWGLMQLTLPTASDMKGGQATIDELNDPETSIHWAAKYLYTLSLIVGDDAKRIIMGYNEGPGNVLKGKVVEDYYAKWFANWLIVQENP